MTLARRMHHSYEDYVRASEATTTKLEFHDGEIFAMAGGTPEHAELATRVTVLLGSRLKPPCRPYNSDLRIHIEATGLTTYPDVSVVCGELRRAAADRIAGTNPTLLVEVTSRSTEDYDRGEKLRQYQQIPPLQAVLIVSHRDRRVTLVSRTAGGWAERDALTGERVELPVGCLLDVDEVYAGLTLEA